MMLCVGRVCVVSGLCSHLLLQLEQLHFMGITHNDAECLHALDAANGDLQVALEMLMGPGH